ELKATMPNPMMPFWEWMVNSAPRENNFHFVAVEYLSPLFCIPERGKLTKAQSTELAHGITSMGWIVAPHPDHLNQAYGWRQEIVIYRPSTGKPLEPKFRGLIRLLFLMMPVAAADGTVESEELETFHRLISHEITTDEEWTYILAVEAALMRDTNVAVGALPS